MDTLDKLKILTDAAKYDVACTSSGNDRSNDGTGLGSAVGCGICHTFAADGRCVSLLKVLERCSGLTARILAISERVISFI